MLNFLGLMGGGMPHATEQEIVTKGLDTKQADLFTLGDMLERFDFSRISLGGPVFDLVKLRWMNGEYLRNLSPDEFFAAMRATVFSDAYLKAIAPLVQTRIETLGAFGDMADFFFKDNVMPAESVWVPKKRTPEETVAFAAEQLTVLEAALWEPETIEAEMKKLGEAQGWSVKENFMLLRAIITGSVQSPPLMDSLLVFGKARSIDRVRRFIEAQKKRK
jgi:glutamyl-tRNA synthetase